jgi:hypothetical protein
MVSDSFFCKHVPELFNDCFDAGTELRRAVGPLYVAVEFGLVTVVIVHDEVISFREFGFVNPEGFSEVFVQYFETL